MFDSAGGQEMSVQDLLSEFDSALSDNPGIEGVTLLGGEPFSQAEALGSFCEEIHLRGSSVLTFSGFTYKHLKSDRIDGAMRLLDTSDVLIAGPYLQTQLDARRPLLGSMNQEYVFLTDRYSQEDFQMRDKVEITLTADGEVKINGWAESQKIESFAESLRKIGLVVKP